MVTTERLEALKAQLIQNCKAGCSEGYLDGRACRSCLLEFRARHCLLLGNFSPFLLEFPPEELFDRIQLDDHGKEVLRWWLTHLDDVDRQGLHLYVFSVTTGVGKTSLATMLAKAYALHFLAAETLKLDLSSQFMETGEFCDLGVTRDSWDRREWQEFEKKWNADLWVVDEFGNETYRSDRDRERQAKLLENFVRFRIRQCRPMIVTSNLRPQDVGTRYSGLMSSLLESSSANGGLYFRHVQVYGTDLRFMEHLSRWGSASS